jgi:hypothetical protein
MRHGAQLQTKGNIKEASEGDLVGPVQSCRSAETQRVAVIYGAQDEILVACGNAVARATQGTSSACKFRECVSKLEIRTAYAAKGIRPLGNEFHLKPVINGASDGLQFREGSRGRVYARKSAAEAKGLVALTDTEVTRGIQAVRGITGHRCSCGNSARDGSSIGAATAAHTAIGCRNSSKRGSLVEVTNVSGVIYVGTQ